MEIKDVVMKLIGPVEPVGESHTDDRRFNNLKELCDLVEELVTEINRVCPNRTCHEHSMKQAGEYAYRFLYERLGIEE